MSERFKIISNIDDTPKSYFWRTTQQQEIDYIEEHQNTLFAWEFKFSSLKRSFLSKTFSNAYPGSVFNVITQDNYHEFLSAPA